MLFTWFSYIRKQPKAVRERYAFFLTAGLVAVIAVVWSFSLPARFSSLSATESERQAASAPFAGVWQSIKSQLPGQVQPASTTEGAGSTTPNQVEAAVRQAQSGEVVPARPPAVQTGNVVQIGTSTGARSVATSSVAN